MMRAGQIEIAPHAPREGATHATTPVLHPPAPDPSSPVDAPPRSVSTRGALSGAAWSIGAYALSQVLRLAGNVILARLLVPEAFGLMAIINSLAIALQMFSDVGIGPALIQRADGEERRLRHTAFTIQAVRGLVLWIFAGALAWPLSRLYGAPDLLWLVPVASLTALAAGFNSTRLFTLNRTLRLARLALIDLAAYALSIVVMIAWALVSPSVWALVAGAIVYAGARMTLSHLALPGEPDAFVWDPAAARDLLHFGKWIFLSTLVGFIVNHADRLILGGFLTMRELGLYAIAATLARFVIQGHQTVSRQVLFPYYSRLAEQGHERLRREVFRLRLVTIAAGAPVLAAMTAFGPQVIALLYDPRYADAGWMLQALAVGAAFTILPAVGPVDLAMGNSRLFATLIAIRAALLLASMALGGAIWGSMGLIVGTAAASTLQYPVTIWLCRRFGVWFPILDAVGLGAFVLLTAIGLGIAG